MPLYISELTPSQLTLYHQSFYKKIDYALRSGTSCFANLASLTMEEIDAMEIGGFPAYYTRRSLLYDRPPDAQIQAQRAAKRIARKGKKLEEIKRTLQAEGPKPIDSLAERLIGLLGDLLQEDVLVVELVGWIEESGLLCCRGEGEDAAVAAKDDEILSESIDQGVDVSCSHMVAAAEGEVPATSIDQGVEFLAVSCSELPAAEEVCCSNHFSAAANLETFEELWPALPSRPASNCSCLPAATAAKPKDVKKSGKGDVKKGVKQEKRPRQSRIQAYLQNPSLLKGLPVFTLVMQPLFPSK